jgi:nitrogen fixation protein NifT
MKVMLRRNNLGHLSVYVPKKDLEEEVVNRVDRSDGTVLTLANGWELAFADLGEHIQLPQTFEARKLA